VLLQSPIARIDNFWSSNCSGLKPWCQPELLSFFSTLYPILQ
jgi:hypothetical protein